MKEIKKVSRRSFIQKSARPEATISWISLQLSVHTTSQYLMPRLRQLIWLPAWLTLGTLLIAQDELWILIPRQKSSLEMMRQMHTWHVRPEHRILYRIRC